MTLVSLDWAVVLVFFGLMLVVGAWAHSKNRDSRDYFTLGGKMPWWLSGISHHVSGYSGAVFVAYAGLAYTHGFSIYVWWSLTVGLSILVTASVFPVRWVRLRQKFSVQSPLEYLAKRYGVRTQLIIAWSGVILKLFDVGAKWAAIAILLKVFTGLPIHIGILISGSISIVYITIGGLWAVTITDFIQFVVQVVAGVVMFIAVLSELGGWDSVFTVWDQLPEANRDPFREPYTILFVVMFLFINTLSYNGGTWNLATKYISSPSERDTKRAAILSGCLYLTWPLILFFPMWAAPVLLPDIADPTESYGLLTLNFLPAGMVGLVMASMFATTMSMTSSDANTISAVITRDILPNLSSRFRNLDHKLALAVAKRVTFGFTLATVVIALQYQSFGGVLGLIISWFAALVGPISIPVLGGMLPVFRHCNSVAALVSILCGFLSFILTKVVQFPYAWEVGLPLVVTFIVFSMFALLRRKIPVPQEITLLLKALKK